eukprot:gene16200-17830_t
MKSEKKSLMVKKLQEKTMLVVVVAQIGLQSWILVYNPLQQDIFLSWTQDGYVNAKKSFGRNAHDEGSRRWPGERSAINYNQSMENCLKPRDSGHAMIKYDNLGHSHLGIKQNMYFHLGYDEKNFMFKDWNITNISTLIGSMIGFLVLGFLYEGLKALRERLREREANMRMQANFDLHNNLKSYGERQPLARPDHRIKIGRTPMCSKLRLVQACLHMLQMFLGYVLMLAFMAYNGWICIAILLGGGLGYLVFTWLVVQPQSDTADHCM